MTDPITFTAIAGTTRIEAMLGQRVVGVAWKHSDAGGRSLGQVEAVWISYFPEQGSPTPAHHTSSMTAARRSLISKIADWHEQADPLRYSSMIIDLRKQAEGERG